MLLNSHISAYTRCLAGKVCGLVRSTSGTSLGEDKLGARDKILNTKVACRACAGQTFPPGPNTPRSFLLQRSHRSSSPPPRPPPATVKHGEPQRPVGNRWPDYCQTATFHCAPHTPQAGRPLASHYSKHSPHLGRRLRRPAWLRGVHLLPTSPKQAQPQAHKTVVDRGAPRSPQTTPMGRRSLLDRLWLWPRYGERDFYPRTCRHSESE